MPISNGSFVIPSIASLGIQVTDVIEDSTRMLRRPYPMRGDVKGALRSRAGAMAAPEGQRPDRTRDGDGDQRLVRAAVFHGRRRALGLALDDALPELPDTPARSEEHTSELQSP